MTGQFPMDLGILSCPLYVERLDPRIIMVFTIMSSVSYLQLENMLGPVITHEAAECVLAYDLSSSINDDMG